MYNYTRTEWWNPSCNHGLFFLLHVPLQSAQPTCLLEQCKEGLSESGVPPTKLPGEHQDEVSYMYRVES